MKKKTTQVGLIKKYYKNNPNRNISHPEIVDWVTAEYKKRTGEVFRDPDRAIRKLFQEGFLIQVDTGVYRYEPENVKKKILEDFSSVQKKEIFERDNYRCVICGNGLHNGFKIYADHIKAKDKGGKATIENGQTLCGPHNNKKKNYKQTETGKKMFIRLYDAAKAIGDTEMMKFCADILEVFEKNNVNDHIEWKRNQN